MPYQTPVQPAQPVAQFSKDRRTISREVRRLVRLAGDAIYQDRRSIPALFRTDDKAQPGKLVIEVTLSAEQPDLEKVIGYMKRQLEFMRRESPRLFKVPGARGEPMNVEVVFKTHSGLRP